MYLGDFAATLPQALARLGAQAVLVHVDLGSGDKEASEKLARFVAPQVRALMRPGAALVSDQAMTDAGLRPLDLPAGVKPGRYHMSQAI